jgi:hypothetical protein
MRQGSLWYNRLKSGYISIILNQMHPYLSSVQYNNSPLKKQYPMGPGAMLYGIQLVSKGGIFSVSFLFLAGVSSS